jgi:RNA polymerase sigma factor (TIGR02999 family)
VYGPSIPEPSLTAPAAEPLTDLLRSWSRGDIAARDRLIPLVYAELRRRAAAHLRRERAGHTLDPSALVHEAFLRLMSGEPPDWRNRAQFFGVASEVMRRVLVEHARRRDAGKRRHLAVTLSDEIEQPSPPADVLALDETLRELARLDARQARLVEVRYFGGLSNEETAEALGVSLATVKREWASARAWLYQRLRR